MQLEPLPIQPTSVWNSIKTDDQTANGNEFSLLLYQPETDEHPAVGAAVTISKSIGLIIRMKPIRITPLIIL